MADYIPSGEGERMAWLQRFAAWMNGHGVGHGFTQAEVMMLYFDVSQAVAAASANATMQAAARASRGARHAAVAAVISRSRDFAQRLQNDPGMTDADRRAAGLAVHDGTKRPGDPMGILGIVPPLLLLDFGVRRLVTIHWGPNPGDERHNGRPQGVIGCQIQYCKGGVPEHEADWVTLDVVTESPCVHTVHEDQSATFAYRACYVGKDLKHGPYGNVAECTVSV